jgi:hypothetical protein
MIKLDISWEAISDFSTIQEYQYQTSLQCLVHVETYFSRSTYTTYITYTHQSFQAINNRMDILTCYYTQAQRNNPGAFLHFNFLESRKACGERDHKMGSTFPYNVCLKHFDV